MRKRDQGPQCCREGNSMTPRLNYSSKVLSTKILMLRQSSTHLSLTHLSLTCFPLFPPAALTRKKRAGEIGKQENRDKQRCWIREVVASVYSTFSASFGSHGIQRKGDGAIKRQHQREEDGTTKRKKEEKK